MGSKYNFDKIIDRRHIDSYKWNVKDNEYSFSIADMDFEVIPEIKESIIKQANISTYGYTYVSDRYYEAYIKWWKSRYDTTLKKDWFMFSISVVASIDSAIKRLTSVNDGISLFSPNYNVFYNCINNNHRNVIEIPFDYKDYKYSINWDLVEQGISKSKMFILCNPHNPIGRQFSEDEILRIVNICKKHNAYIISDEIHADIDYNGSRYVPTLKVSDYEKLIVMLSPGKTFNVAGLHSSVVITPNLEIKSIIEKGLQEDDVGEPSFFSIAPIIAAYENGEEYVNELNDYLKQNRVVLKEFFDKNGLKLRIIDNNSTYLLWIDISAYSSNSEEFTNQLFAKNHILVCSGKNYHEHHSSFIRVNIATNRNNIIKFCEEIKDFLLKGENKK